MSHGTLEESSEADTRTSGRVWFGVVLLLMVSLIAIGIVSLNGIAK